MSALGRDEYCRRFVEYMVVKAGYKSFDDGSPINEYAERVAPAYWQNLLNNSPEEAADADMACWET